MTGQIENLSAMVAPAPEALQRALGLKGRVHRYGRGRTLIGEGEQANDVFLILEGQARVLLFSPSGREVAVRLLSAGELFGDLAALDAAPRCANVVATTELRALIVSRADFLGCLNAATGANAWMIQRLVAEVRRLTERNFELSALSVQSRLHCELFRLARGCIARGGLPEISPAPTHAEFASRIGTHREAVTRELRVLVQRDIIRTRRRALEFLDLAGLAESVDRAVGAMAEASRAI